MLGDITLMIKTFIVCSIVGLMVVFAGCDALFVSEIKLAPSQKDMVSTTVVSVGDWEESLALFKRIAEENGYLLEESQLEDGKYLYIANGGNWYGPMMDIGRKEDTIVVGVVQYAGMFEFGDYKKLKKEVFRAFSEAFGQERVTMRKIR
jgi:hypothetical protein